MSSGHYQCDKLYFNTGLWWRCYDDSKIKLIGSPYNMHSDASDQRTEKKKKMMKGSDNIVSMLCIKEVFFYHTVMNLLLDSLLKMKE